MTPLFSHIFAEVSRKMKNNFFLRIYADISKNWPVMTLWFFHQKAQPE